MLNRKKRISTSTTVKKQVTYNHSAAHAQDQRVRILYGKIQQNRQQAYLLFEKKKIIKKTFDAR
jgi:hypothetical protein